MGGFGGRPGGAGPAARTSRSRSTTATSATCSAACSAAGGGGAAARRGQRRRPPPRRRPRGRAAPVVQRRRQRREHHAVPHVRRGLLAPATAAAPSPAPARGSAPVCQGRGVVDDNQGFFSFSQPCTACQGTGVIVDDPCPTCRGTGVERRQREVKVRIPAGVDDGQRIRLKGRGGPGRNGGPAGDLFVTVQGAARHRVRPRRATTSSSACRSPSRRPPSAPRCRCRCSTARRSRVQDPAGHAAGQQVPGEGQGRAGQARARAT